MERAIRLQKKPSVRKKHTVWDRVKQNADIRLAAFRYAYEKLGRDAFVSGANCG